MAGAGEKRARRVRGAPALKPLRKHRGTDPACTVLKRQVSTPTHPQPQNWHRRFAPPLARPATRAHPHTPCTRDGHWRLASSADTCASSSCPPPCVALDRSRAASAGARPERSSPRYARMRHTTRTQRAPRQTRTRLAAAALPVGLTRQGSSGWGREGQQGTGEGAGTRPPSRP